MDCDSKLECCKKPGVSNIQDLEIEPANETTNLPSETVYENTYIAPEGNRIETENTYTIIYQSKHDLTDDSSSESKPNKKLRRRMRNQDDVSAISEINAETEVSIPGSSEDSKCALSEYSENTNLSTNESEDKELFEDDSDDDDCIYCNDGPEQELLEADLLADSDEDSMTTTSQ